MSTLAHRAVAPAAHALRSEAGLARLALGIGALHVVDDNFLQPQPGTSAVDHLPGGLIQTAFFVLLAWAYPRLRPGLRGTLAIFVGLFMIVMGAGEAGYYSREDGPSGDDYTGLLTIPAGVLLVGVGVAALWRSRKSGGRIRRYARRIALGFAFLLGLYVFLYPVAESYVITHAARAYVPDPALGAAFEEVSFTTSDGLQLEGWYVPSRNGATVISYPGRKGSQKPARLLARHGYGVLLFDRRGEGESEGDPNTLGWRGVRDLRAAIAYLESRPDVDMSRVGGVGLSVGGEMLLQAAAETDDFKAVVSEGAGMRSIREAVDLSGSDKFVAVPIFGLVTLAAMVWTSDLPPPGLTGLSGEITEPVLLIHATPGQGGETLSRTYYEAATGPKEYWAAPGGHTGALDAAPEEYERRVVGFFDRTIGRPQAREAPAAAAVTGPLCDLLPSGDDPGAPASLTGEPADVALQWIPVLTTFEAAVRASGLADDLRRADGVTILAPTDDAFTAAFDRQTLDDLLLSRPRELRAILEAHIVDGSLSLAALRKAGRVTTRDGDVHTVAPAGAMARFDDSAMTVCADYDVANARIHVIDRVLR